LIEIEAGGGVLYRIENGRPLLLLIYRNGVWDLPKGKLEGGESISECAAREVAEEVGLEELPSLDGDLSVTIHFYEEGGEKVKKITHWYSMSCARMPEVLTPQSEEGITDLEWSDIESGREKVGYQNLVDVISRFENWYKKRK